MAGAAPRHNEFYNILTDLLPLLFFFGAAIYTMAANVRFAIPAPSCCPSSGWIASRCSLRMRRPAQPGYAASPPWLRHSFLMTTAFTVAQHALSCAAHIFSAVSARLSHTVWLLDYAGIALINLHNAPAVIFIGWPQLGEPLWCWWFAANLLATVLIFGRSLHLTLTCQIPPQVGGSILHRCCSCAAREHTNTAGSSRTVAAPQGMVWSQILADNGMLAAVGIATLIAPNMLGSLAVGFVADWRAGAVPPIMLFALIVKEAHAPERWYRAGKFDHSLFHSHSLWHLLVWLVQTLYLLVYLSNFDQYGRAAQQQPQQWE